MYCAQHAQPLLSPTICAREPIEVYNQEEAAADNGGR